MNPYTGQVVAVPEGKEQAAEDLGFTVPVRRDLTFKEAADMQIRLYSPCACGSGRKFKFCCKRSK